MTTAFPVLHPRAARAAWSVAAIFVLATCACGFAADPKLPPGLDDAVMRGLEFLATQQNNDGSFGPSHRPAMTSLALLSYLASGHTANAGNVGKFGTNVRGAVDYLLTQAQPDGSFGRHERPMLGQAMATLALAEAYGAEESEPQRKRIAATLNASVKLIVSAQESRKPDLYSGGWHYDANSAESDLAVSGWMILALRACQDVGVAVPKGTLNRASKFVLKCYSADAKGFASQPGAPVDAGATAIGLLCLQLLDATQRPEAEAAGRIFSEKPGDDAPYSYFGGYCLVLAALQVGDPTWRDASLPVFDKLIKMQQTDGSWPEAAESEFPAAGKIYSTSTALLTLSVCYHLLPMQQR